MLLSATGKLVVVAFFDETANIEPSSGLLRLEEAAGLTNIVPFAQTDISAGL